MAAKWRVFSVADFACALGVSPASISKDLRCRIRKAHVKYQRLDALEHEHVVLNVLKELDAYKFDQAGIQRRRIWEKAWGERLEIVTRADGTRDSLIPNFLNRHPIVRLCRKYVRPADTGLELTFLELFRRYVFMRYFNRVSSVYEFGCGSGYNLLLMAELFPKAEIIGLDWSVSAIKIVDLIARKHQANIKGIRFDLFRPDRRIKLPDNTAVLTMDALEQVGARFEPFLQYLLDQRPRVCVHIEPISDLYDQDNLLDYLAWRYHSRRNYLKGYLTCLRKLEKQRKIELIEVRRTMYGGLYHEGCSLIVWRRK